MKLVSITVVLSGCVLLAFFRDPVFIPQIAFGFISAYFACAEGNKDDAPQDGSLKELQRKVSQLSIAVGFKQKL